MDRVQKMSRILSTPYIFSGFFCWRGTVLTGNRGIRVYQAEPESKQIRAFMAAIGLDYDTLTKEEFVSIISGLKKSKYLKSPISQRGKTEETLKRGAALRRDEGCIYLHFLFRTGGFCFSKILHLCHLDVTKSACPAPHKFRWRNQRFRASLILPPKSVCQPLSARTADGEANPFSAPDRSKGITH